MKDKKPTLFVLFEGLTIQEIEEQLNNFSLRNAGMVVISCNTVIANGTDIIIVTIAYKLY